MKKLYVGCRVRILWSDTWPELRGTEGRIIGRWGDIPVIYTGRRKADWIVAPDAWPDGKSPIPEKGFARTFFAPSSDQLEPIQPEGMQPASWADCLWSPKSGFRYDKVTA